MAQVLIERPRRGLRGSLGYREQRRRKRREPIDARRREGIGRREYGHDKFFNDLFGPVIRFLRANIGRPWDLVYREICAANDLRNTASRHLRHHVFDFVIVNVREEAGRLYAATDWGYRELNCYGRRLFYVCPGTKLLKSAADLRPRPKRPANRIKVSRLRQYHRVNGRWFEVALRAPPDAASGCCDALLGKPVSEFRPGEARATYGLAAYALSTKPVDREQGRRLNRQAAWRARR